MYDPELVRVRAPLTTALALARAGHEADARAVCHLARERCETSPCGLEALDALPAGDLDGALQATLAERFGMAFGAPDAAPSGLSAALAAAAAGGAEAQVRLIDDLVAHLAKSPGDSEAHLWLALGYRCQWLIESGYRATWRRLGLPPVDMAEAAVAANHDATPEKLACMFEHLVRALSPRREDLGRNLHIHQALAGWLRDIDHGADAELHYRIVLRALTINGEAHKALGEILLAKGAAGEAVVHLEAALEQLGDPVAQRRIHGQLGLARRLSGEPLRAMEHFFQAVTGR
ncbi:MAG: hypothetical protein O7A68_07710 [Alphaproteobacteria bacterium]|nr:hypothetical protein [Alphaproteobacteria bacterium]